MPITLTRNPNLVKTKKRVDLINEVQKNFEEVYKTSWWTGLAPKECPGFDHKRNCLTSLPLINLDICTRQDILDYFNNSWTLTELLFYGIKTEETYIRPPYHELRHPMIFYYGHTAVIYINKMRIAKLVSEPINLYLEKVLETGVDEMSWDDMSKNHMKWPSLKDVHAYRKTVYDLITNMIKTHTDFDFKENKRKVLMDSPWWALWMGLEHEKIHFETSSVLIRELPIELVETPPYFAPMHPSFNKNEEIQNEWIKRSGATVEIGKDNNFPSFGWDNEYGKRKISIKDFSYTKYQITNREYYDFVKSGAYVLDQYWEPEGRAWRKFRNTKRPCFWAAVGPEGAHEYELRTIFEMISMPWNWPCEVNFHEAMAYANWKKATDQSSKHYRLLTEGEFISMREPIQDPVLQKKPYSQYREFFEEFNSNFNFVWSTPKNVDADLYGNVWHWVMDQFNPLDNFKTNYLYDDFSTPCFDGKHQMILGGSFIACGDEASHWSRFHFRPHFYQHSGFRLAYTEDGSSDNGAIKLLKSAEYVHPRRMNVLDQMNHENWWKNINQPLDMTSEEQKAIFDQSLSHLTTYLTEQKKHGLTGIAFDPYTNDVKKEFTVPHIQTKEFPVNPESYEVLLKNIFETLAPLSHQPGTPGFCAYVAGSTNPISTSANLMAGMLNPFTGHYMMAPGLVTLEEEAIAWFKNLFGFNEETANGFFTTGSSLAALSAIMMARQNKIKNHDFSNVTGYISSEGHHSLHKNWVMLGFKKENLRMVPSKNFKIDCAALTALIENDIKNKLQPLLIVSIAGTTKTGSVDPIDQVDQIAKKFNLWHHVDGTYGGPFMLTTEGKKLLKGIQNADSLTIDLHKAMSLPYGTGLLLVQNEKNMIFNYAGDDSYMPPGILDHASHLDFADSSPELSRDYRGLRVWLPIKTLGISPFVLNLEEKMQLIRHAHQELEKMSKITVTSEPELTILSFKHHKGNDATKKLMAKINEEGTLFLSGAKINGEDIIRLCLLNHRTHFETLNKGLSVIFKLSEEI